MVHNLKIPYQMTIASRYVGDEYGYFSVLKYDFEEGNIQHTPYQIPADIIAGKLTYTNRQLVTMT